MYNGMTEKQHRAWCAEVAPRARRWFERHLTGGERTPSAAGGILCEGTARCMDIVAAADRARLRVEVNGQDMRGFGRSKRAPAKRRSVAC